jgi:hypothetical protein
MSTPVPDLPFPPFFVVADCDGNAGTAIVAAIPAGAGNAGASGVRDADTASEALPLPPPAPAMQARPRWPSPAAAMSRDLACDATRHILELADSCSSLNSSMRLMSEAAAASPSGRAGLAGKPAFRALVKDFAAALTLLTAAVDQLQESGEDWEFMIADSHLLKTLRAGVAGWQRHVRSTCAGGGPRPGL